MDRPRPDEGTRLSQLGGTTDTLVLMRRESRGKGRIVGTPIRNWIALVVAGLTISAVGAPPPDVPEQVRAAVAALSSPRLVERQTAERQLMELGPLALQHLPPPDLVESVAAREALRRVRIHLETRSATDSLKPSVVTLPGNGTATGLVEQMQQQARVRIQLSEQLPAAQAGKTFSGKPQPFWRALDSVAALAGGRWEFAPEPEVILIEPTRAGAEETPMQETWQTSPESFIVRVLGFENKKLESGRLLRFRLGLSAEPRLRPLLFTYAASDILATTAAGDRLTSWNPAARYETAAGIASREWPITAEFLLPENDQSERASVQGEIHALVATGQETIIFDDWWKGRRTWLRRGGATAALGRVRITRTSEGTENADIEVTLTYDTEAPPLESHQRWVLHQAASLRTSDGELIPFARSEVSEEQGGGMTVRYTFEGIPDSRTTALIYQPATTLLSVPVRFEITGISLP